jgi:hypothetical protein
MVSLGYRSRYCATEYRLRDYIASSNLRLFGKVKGEGIFGSMFDFGC